MNIIVTKYVDGLIIYPELSDELGNNIQGPSLIKTPEWLPNSLAKYYLYFADHKGNHIKMAYADNLLGPWNIYSGGTLQLEHSGFLTESPEMPRDFDSTQSSVGLLEGFDPHPEQSEYIPTRLDDMMIPHIASPDVHVDNEKKQIIMFYHGLEKFGTQSTKVAISSDGINFKNTTNIVSRPYFRRFKYKGTFYGMAMPGFIYKNTGDIDEYTEIKRLFPNKIRHSGVFLIEDTLYVFYSLVEDVPERIYVSTIELNTNAENWKESNAKEVIRPTLDWEGVNLPLQHSSRSSINIPVNQLRDPYIFKDEDDMYLLYTAKGERGIGICHIEIDYP
jgi:hypothetical protein